MNFLLTSVNSIEINFNRIYCSKQLGCHGYYGTWKIQTHSYSKTHLTTLNLNNIKMIEAKGLKIVASRSPWMH
jgi:hypothetical protein